MLLPDLGMIAPALSIALAASFPLQVVNQVVNDGRCICASVHRLGCCFIPWILWGSGGIDGMEVSPGSHQAAPDGAVIPWGLWFHSLAGG